MTLGSAFEDLLAALDRVELPFVIGGSVASGTYGLPRHTNDIDIVADLARDRVREFCNALQPIFYVDAETVEQAIELDRPFNVIHIKGAYKFDIFPGSGRFAQSELARRRYMTTPIPGLENIEFPIASPEDTILSKLVWFRKGGERSEQQWYDILGVIHVQAGLLDLEYLQQWAAQLGVSDLLAKVLSASA